VAPPKLPERPSPSVVPEAKDSDALRSRVTTGKGAGPGPGPEAAEEAEEEEPPRARERACACACVGAGAREKRPPAPALRAARRAERSRAPSALDCRRVWVGRRAGERGGGARTSHRVGVLILRARPDASGLRSGLNAIAVSANLTGARAVCTAGGLEGIYENIAFTVGEKLAPAVWGIGFVRADAGVVRGAPTRARACLTPDVAPQLSVRRHRVGSLATSVVWW
jgi:hypothetical protein